MNTWKITDEVAAVIYVGAYSVIPSLKKKYNKKGIYFAYRSKPEGVVHGVEDQYDVEVWKGNDRNNFIFATSNTSFEVAIKEAMSKFK